MRKESNRDFIQKALFTAHVKGRERKEQNAKIGLPSIHLFIHKIALQVNAMKGCLISSSSLFDVTSIMYFISDFVIFVIVFFLL